MEFYENPIQRDGDFADPFVLRYNGRYYLYCTNPDVRCWSSRDLINWNLEGSTIEPDTFPGLVPFAPEVVYWNGSFFMYTSPSGLGHYVLESDSPTGPFRKITENVGHSIDGSVFIDDDGKWYFYWADDSGILGCEMTSPTEFGETIHTGSFMYGWTEGPFVLKHNGRYHMTYTGNHYLSRGYRINAALSENPIKGYVDYPYNPILVHTEGEGVGLGHSCTVYGPDMMTHYIIYHNINSDRSRDLNIDPVVLEDTPYVLGPTRCCMPVPAYADFSDDFDSSGTRMDWFVEYGNWKQGQGRYESGCGAFQCHCREKLPAEGVIEFNLGTLCEEDSDYGVIFGKKDASYRILLNCCNNSIRLLSDYGKVMEQQQLPVDFTHTALHCLQLRYSAECTVLYIDGRKQMEIGPIICCDDSFGYYSQGIQIFIGYTAFSKGNENTVNAKLFYPVPCTIAIKDERYADFRFNISETSDLVFNIYCEEILKMTGRLPITIDGKEINVILTVSEGADTLTFNLELSCGLHEISFNFPSGMLEPKKITVFTKSLEISIVEKIKNFGPYGKICMGEYGMSNYEVEAVFEVQPKTDDACVGVMFRMTEPSEGGEGEDRFLGLNFFIGYCVSLEQNAIVLTKHRYDERELVRKQIECDLSQKHSLRVKAISNEFMVFMDGRNEPEIQLFDPDALMFGKAGLRVKECILLESTVKIAYM